MKAIILFLICVFCFTGNSFAQWTEQTSGVSTGLYSVSAVDDYVVWAVGLGGVVLRTTNSGVNWNTTASPNALVDLYTVQGIDAMVALTGGANATGAYAFKTTDGGVTWTQTFFQAGGFVNSIDKFNGFPVCGMLCDPVGGRWGQYVSFDFGSTWDSTGYYNPAPPGEAGWNNSFFSATPSFFSYYGTNNTKIYQPFANGTVLTHPTPGLINSFAIWGTANDRLMIGGVNAMLFSTNGGVNWTNVNAIGSGIISGITGAISNWFYTRGLNIHKSTNDGASWTTDYTSTGNFNHLFLSPRGLYIWAVREDGGISRYLSDFPLPVELASFVSTVSGSNVTLNWSTSLETNNAGFDIERTDVNGQVSGDWRKVGYVNGSGTTNEMTNYSFTDRGLQKGHYNYRLKQTDINGNFEYFNLSNEVIVGSPEKFSLSQNYPNPFNPSTKINYDLPYDASVSLTVYDMTGKEVAKLVNEFKPAGYYVAEFNAANLSTGVYLYRISAVGNNQNLTSEKRMVLVK